MRLKIRLFGFNPLFLLAFFTTIIFTFTLVKLKHFAPADFSSGAGAAPAIARETLGRLPLSFEANHGQSDGPVDFIARGPGYSIFLSATEATMAFRQNESGRLRMRLKGSDRAARGAGLEEARGKSNYILNRDPRRWRAGVSHFRKARYEGVYPGVDLIYYGAQGQLEYDFIVAPHAEPRAIKLAFEGAEQIRVDENGDLVLRVAGGELRQRKPVIYQNVNGARRLVEGGYAQPGAHEISFAISDYDRNRALVIDPVILYSTFLGGNSQDSGQSIALDAAGNIYVMGVTTSTNYPVTSQALKKTSAAGQADIFVTKLSPAGAELIYSTYLGSDTGSDEPTNFAVDAAGVVYITGRTNAANFPVTSNAAQSNLSGESDAFVTKLNATGSALLYSTLLGGSNRELGRGIAIDATGNIFVTGQTDSNNFPTTEGALQRTLGNVAGNAFIAKFMATGAVAYSTLYGAGAFAIGDAIVADSTGNAFVAGIQNSGSVNPSPDRMFALKLNPGGSQILFNFSPTSVGGNITSAGDVALDNAGNLYVTGNTTGGFTATPGAFQTTPGGRVDAFVMKLNSAGALTYFTYLGGSESEDGIGLALDNAGNIYVAGWTISSDFPTLNGPQRQYGGGGLPFGDGFITKLKADGSALLYSTYLGGYDNEAIVDIAVDNAGNAYVTGVTATAGFPVTPGAPQISFGGQADVFIAKIGEGDAGLVNASAASYTRFAIARESIVAAFGASLATATQSAGATPLPTMLAGTSVAVKDSAGVERLAPLFFVSPNQVNYQVPPGSAPGTALVRVSNANGAQTNSVVFIESVAPALFTANSTGEGAPSAYVLRVRPDNSRSNEPVIVFDAAQNKFVPLPLDFGQDDLFLILFGCGVRFRNPQPPVFVEFRSPGNSTPIFEPAIYADAQGEFVGLEQINVKLPRSLAGAGEVSVRVTAADDNIGRNSNEVKISFK